MCIFLVCKIRTYTFIFRLFLQTCVLTYSYPVEYLYNGRILQNIMILPLITNQNLSLLRTQIYSLYLQFSHFHPPITSLSQRIRKRVVKLSEFSLLYCEMKHINFSSLLSNKIYQLLRFICSFSLFDAISCKNEACKEDASEYALNCVPGYMRMIFSNVRCK